MAVEHIYGSSGNDTIFRKTGSQWIEGLAGNDTLGGGLGADTVDGGAGNDVLYGGDDTDPDRLIGGTGDDSFWVNGREDVIVEAAGEGTDTVYAKYSWALGANLENLTLQEVGASANGSGTGNELANRLTGNSGRNLLDGRNGNDMLYGLGGNDTMWGGAGNDLLDGGTGDDVIGGGIGTDTLFGGLGNDTLYAGNDGDKDWLSGGAGDDVYWINGTAQDVIQENAGEGIDTVFIQGNGQLAANVENLVVQEGGSSPFSVSGNDLANGMLGSSRANRIAGGGGNDAINGRGGDDTLIGGAGDDWLIGGAGADTFLFQGGGEGNDIIADWGNGRDRIDLRALIATGSSLDAGRVQFDTTSAPGATIIRIAQADVSIKVLSAGLGDFDRSQLATTGVISFTASAGPHVIEKVPAYDWYHGCVPTAVGSVLGYWDLQGYSHYFDASGWTDLRQTVKVQDQISSPAHNQKYDPTPDTPSLPKPPSTSIADFINTSADPVGFGATYLSDLEPGLEAYAAWKGHPVDAWTVQVDDTTWGTLVDQINAGHPALLTVDTDADGTTDHEVPVIGYDDRGTEGRWYGAFTTWSEDETVEWFKFEPPAAGKPWTAGYATFVEPLFAPDTVLGAGAVDIGNLMRGNSVAFAAPGLGLGDWSSPALV